MDFMKNAGFNGWARRAPSSRAATAPEMSREIGEEAKAARERVAKRYEINAPFATVY
jgi:hypothetical protein